MRGSFTKTIQPRIPSRNVDLSSPKSKSPKKKTTKRVVTPPSNDINEIPVKEEPRIMGGDKEPPVKIYEPVVV